MTVGFPGLPIGSDPRELSAVVNRMNLGKLNCVGEVALQPNQNSTAVSDSRVTAGSFIGLTPLTAEAASELAAGTLHISERTGGGFTLSHSSTAQTQRRFAYLVIG